MYLIYTVYSRFSQNAWTSGAMGIQPKGGPTLIVATLKENHAKG